MNIHTTTLRMWAAAAEFAATVHHDLTHPGVTGRKWRRPERTCPAWCAQGHYCTAQHGHPTGQHRSAPAAWDTGYGRLIATRIGTDNQTNHVEIRAVIALPDPEDLAGETAQQVLTGVHLTITALTASTEGRRALPGGTR